jgi:hypothetical protein
VRVEGGDGRDDTEGIRLESSNNFGADDDTKRDILQ